MDASDAEDDFPLDDAVIAMAQVRSQLTARARR